MLGLRQCELQSLQIIDGKLVSKTITRIITHQNALESMQLMYRDSQIIGLKKSMQKAVKTLVKGTVRTNPFDTK